MNKKGMLSGVLITLLLTSLLVLVGFKTKKGDSTQKLYQVYLSGEKIGVIKSEEELYTLINEEQKELREKYKVSKIHPPQGLGITPIYTYNKKVNSVKQIYEYIKDKEPFTIEGYEVTIKKEEPIKINLLNKDHLDIALKNTVEAFVNEENLEAYLEATQKEIEDEGSIIELLYLGHEITIKKTLISTEEKIFTDSAELSKYMLFGTLKNDQNYTVKLGDTIEEVADNNKLNVEEFLIANPQIVSKDALLYPSQVVNVALINPLVDIVVESILVENQTIKYETTIEYDNSISIGTKYVKQEGINGLSKATFRLETKNGEITATVPIKNEQISAPVDQIIVMGGQDINYVGDSTYWAWATKKPYVLSSKYGWRWGRMHEGIDISGTGHGSPIYSIQAGTVVEVGYNKTMGNYIYVDHHNGYHSVYMHNSKNFVSKGETVVKGQTIALMGNTGRVSPLPSSASPTAGTHLHLGIFVEGYPYAGGKAIDPLLIYR